MNSYRFHSRWLLTFIAAAILSLGVLAACSGQKTDSVVAGAPRIVPVSVAKAQQRDVPVVVSAIGTITPLQTVQIKSMVTAQIMKVNFKEGQDVRKGQLLFSLDDRTFRADLGKAQGALLKDQAAAANARAQQKRMQALLKEGVIAQQAYDEQDSQASQFDAAVEADKAAVESAKVSLLYCKIYSPIDGRTGDLLVKEGNVIKANDVPLVVINQIAPIYANFAIPERYLADIKKFSSTGTLKVTAMLPDTTTPLAQGKVSFIDNMVDRTTGTIAMKADFVNAERKLWPGQYVNISLQLTTEKNATVVPTQALQNGQQGVYVFVVKADNTVEQRILDLGPATEDVTMVRKGVLPGETVVTDGQVRIVPGSKVEVKAPEKKQASDGTSLEQSSTL
jgi:multidrug efflux system membrane fusion protein